jgi:hypothetical protein
MAETSQPLDSQLIALGARIDRQLAALPKPTIFPQPTYEPFPDEPLADARARPDRTLLYLILFTSEVFWLILLASGFVKLHRAMFRAFISVIHGESVPLGTLRNDRTQLIPGPVSK